MRFTASAIGLFLAAGCGISAPVAEERQPPSPGPTLVYSSGLTLESASVESARLRLETSPVARLPVTRAVVRVPGRALSPRVHVHPMAVSPLASAPVERPPRLASGAETSMSGDLPAVRSGTTGLSANTTIHAQRSGTDTLLAVRVAPYTTRGTERVRIHRAIVDVTWTAAPETSAAPAGGGSAGATVEVRVDRPGIYRVRQPELGAAGFDVTGDPAFFSLSRDGVAIPVHVAGENDGSFDSDDYVEFYARPFRSRFSDQDVYQLEISTQPGARMPILPIAGGAPAPQGALAVLQTVDGPRPEFNLAVRNGAADNFFLAGVTTVTPPPTLTLNVAGPLSTAGGDAVLELDLEGFSEDPGTDPDHRIAATWNGVALAPLIEFDGVVAYTASLTIPMAQVLDGNNDLVLTATGDTGAPLDAVYVDEIRLSYTHRNTVDADQLVFVPLAAGVFGLRGFSDAGRAVILDVTDAAAPVRLSANLALGLNPDPGPLTYEIAEVSVPVDAGHIGARIAVSSDAGALTASLRVLQPVGLDNPTRGADYLVIAPAELGNAAQRLVDARAAQGLVSEWVDVQDVYDELGHGRVTPDAVKEMIRVAVTRWQRAPRFVLLLGDGTFDYKQAIPPVNGEDNRTLIPVRLYDSPFFETATDNWFADISGDDRYPDVALGRLPVSTAAEADAAVDKILAYESRDYGAGFEERFLVVADDISETWEELFPNYSDDLAAGLPSFIAANKVYLGSANHPDANAAATAIRAALQQGVVGANYFGHGARDSWADEDILTAADVLLLTNDSAPTFMGVMNCLNGLFQLPNAAGAGHSLAETALLMDGGAVGFVGTTSLAYADPQVIIDRAFWTLALDPDPIAVGDALMQAKLLLDTSSDPELDVLESWVLLGDPAMALRANHRPVAELTTTGTLFETGARVPLDGSQSYDPDVGQSIGYAYTVVSAPPGSSASPASGASTSEVVPDTAGTYVVQLEVSDGLYTSEPALVTFDAVGEDFLDPPSETCLCTLASPVRPTPSPAAGALFLLGLVAVVARRRR